MEGGEGEEKVKWLLITTVGKNPGDEFVRMGIEKMVRDIDRGCEITLIDKETRAIHRKRDFDRAVLCGMPLFWSYKNTCNWKMRWWPPLMGWLSRNGKMAVMGAGSFQRYKNEKANANINGLKRSVRQVQRRCGLVTVRDRVVSKITSISLPAYVCPAIFSIKDKPITNKYKLCNLMPNGAHYSIFNHNESRIWRRKVGRIAEVLRSNGFLFVAHNTRESRLAKTSGWRNSEIFTYKGSPDYLLNIYKDCGKFFGNRVHGCIVCRGANADVWSCGFDSRQHAVKLSGAKTSLPSEIDLAELDDWAKKPYNNTSEFPMVDEYNKQKNMLSEWSASLCQKNT